MTTLVPVLLAGGVGSRLWPTSREAYPKQLLALAGDESLLQQAAQRAMATAPTDHVVTVTTDAHYFAVLDQLGDIDPDLGRHVIAEPTGRNTAAAIALAALYAEARFTDPILWAAAADHAMHDTDTLANAVALAARVAGYGRLVTFGMTPANPDPTLGYIRRGPALAGVEGAFAVDQFVEKPPRDEAERLIAGGDCYWNSGMFVFSVATLLAAFNDHSPDVLDAVRAAMAETDGDAMPFRVPLERYYKVPSLAFDKAVMEKSDDVAVVPLDIAWSDVGSWDRLWEVSDKDAEGNATHGDVMFEDSRNSLVRADRRLVACAGVDDLVVVETADAVMVASRHDTTGIKSLVERLKEAGRSEATAHLDDRRPWGSFSVLLEGPRFKIKELTIKPGARLSLQMHHHRSEHWVVIEGTARITCNDEERLLEENESTYIPISATHRLENPGKVTLRIVEVQCGSYVGEDDIVRFEDNYGRVEAAS
ncbi:MAG: mannose-1-phosphate guanylyltransferase/mannose-6-phosphate isomerase [Pseudomonadota bacterium]|nr:mannose-1-phosphate guanylyltransferase/mannose-6-phosphate isomerase [Pseudomonadota bacterium]